MPRNLSLHIVHTSIAYLYGTCVANFVEGMGVWKGFPNDSQELLAYVGPYVFAEGWVEPCNFSIPNFISCGVVPGIWIKFKFVIVITSIQSSLVWWNCCDENFFICRDLR